MIVRLLIFICALLSGGCTEQRDLFVTCSPLLHVENKWEPPKIGTDDGATLMFYGQNRCFQQILPNATEHTFLLGKGVYDILSFNAMMYSEQESHLNYIYYKGTDKFKTFEACVTELAEEARFRALPDEVIVNSPDILACRSFTGLEMKGDSCFTIKYDDGKETVPTGGNYIEKTIQFHPCRVTHTCQVIVHVLNPQSAKMVKASLRGFSGSVFLAERMPAHNNVTHQFNLNSMRIDADDPCSGTISSPVFTTFGPPLDLPNRRYELEVTVLLVNGNEFGPVKFDVTEQVKHCITYLNSARNSNIPITETQTIEVFSLELPVVVGDTDVGIGDWGNTVIIIIPT